MPALALLLLLAGVGNYPLNFALPKQTRGGGHACLVCTTIKRADSGSNRETKKCQTGGPCVCFWAAQLLNVPTEVPTDKKKKASRGEETVRLDTKHKPAPVQTKGS